MFNKQNFAKKLFHSILTLQFMCVTTFNSLHACTFVSMANKKISLAGYNEDFLDLRTGIWFIPGTSDSYGCMIWGYDRASYQYQGGVNDQGLFVDMNAINTDSGWKPDPEKENMDTDIDMIEFFLKNLASVDDAIEFFKEYNVDLGYIMITMADARGESVIFEWNDDQLWVLRKNKTYQICTNDLLSPAGIPIKNSDIRFDTADRILQNQSTPSIDLIRRVLSATCAQFDYSTTLYSTICDLKNKKIYLYHFHNYEEVVVFDLKEELAKGELSYSIPGLFQVQPYSIEGHKSTGRQLGDILLQKLIAEKGIKDGISAFQVQRNYKRIYNKYIVQDWIIKNAALDFMNKNKTQEAIEVFKLNTTEFPESSEVYFDLGEAYLRLNQVPLALENYKKALERDPGNEKINELLKILQKNNK